MKKIHIIHLLASLAAVFALSVQLLNAQSATYFDALKKMQEGNLPEARVLFEKEIAQNPDNDAAYFFLSSVIDFKKETKLVENYMKKAVELSPDNFWYKYELAVFYANTERPELTDLIFEELVKDYPKKSSLYLDMVNLYMSQNEIDKAIATIDKLEKLRGKNEAMGMTKLELMSKKADANPDSLYAYIEDYYKDCKTPRLAVMLGDYYLRSYKDSLALSYYQEATQMEPGYSPAYYGMAHIYQIRRQYDKFFENISHFIEDPGINPQAKAEYLSGITDSPQFTKTFAPEIDSLMELAHSAHPNDTTINLMLSGYYYRTGRPYISADLLKQNTDINPESLNAVNEYLIFLYYQQAWPSLQQHASVFLQRFPSNPSILQLRSIAFMQMDNIDAAIEDNLAIFEQKPKDSLVFVSTCTTLGDLYHQKGDNAKSYSYYEKAIKRGPDHAPALNNYAYFLALEGKKLKKAKVMSKKTIEKEPNNPTYLDTYAWILHLMGDNMESKAIFKHAMLYGGKDSPDMLYHYAEVLEALGEGSLASIYRNQAKALEMKTK